MTDESNGREVSFAERYPSYILVSVLKEWTGGDHVKTGYRYDFHTVTSSSRSVSSCGSLFVYVIPFQNLMSTSVRLIPE